MAGGFLGLQMISTERAGRRAAVTEATEALATAKESLHEVLTRPRFFTPAPAGLVACGFTWGRRLAHKIAIHPQTAERPVWKVGNKWTFKDDTNPPPAESTWTREVREALPTERSVCK